MALGLFYPQNAPPAIAAPTLPPMVSTKGIQLTAQGQHRLRRGLPIPESGPLDPLQVPLRVAASGIGGNDVHL